MKKISGFVGEIKGSLGSGQVMTRVMDALDGRNAAHALRVLNLVLPQVIPFNRPLGVRIRELTHERSEVEIPFKRANKNHLGGMHACAMATVGEYAAGLLILRRVDPTKQRIVLRNLSVDYLKQGRATAVAEVEWPENAPRSVDALRDLEEPIELKMRTVLRSKDGVELAHIHTLWQVKPWSKVRGRQ